MKKTVCFLKGTSLLAAPLLLCACMFVFSCKNTIPNDSDVFTSFEPLEWNDSYVCTATNNPQSVLVWNSEDFSLVREYRFLSENERRFLDIMDISYSGKDVWFIVVGKKLNLVHLDMQTGSVEFADVSFSPHSVNVVHGANGEAVVWANSMGEPNSGMDFACFSLSGTLLDSFHIAHRDLLFSSTKNIFYYDQKYLMLGEQLSDCQNINSKQEMYFLLDLTNHSVKTLDSTAFFTKEFLSEQLPFSDITDFTCGMCRFEVGNEVFLCASLTTSYLDSFEDNISARFLFRQNGIEPFSISFMNTKWNQRHPVSISKNDDDLFVCGNSDYDGLELAVYPASGGVQKKYAELTKANMLLCTQKNGCTWFSCDSWPYILDSDGGVLGWDRSVLPSVYVLNHKTGAIYNYDSAGVRTNVEYVPGEQKYTTFFK